MGTQVARPGAVAFFGSGEAAPTGRRVHDWLFRRLSPPVRVAVLETPAGFEVNSAHVAGRIADFLQARLQNYHPEVAVVPARRRGEAFGPDNPEVLSPLLAANYIFMGAGSPTYAVRHLAHTRAWELIVARHRLGATLSFASAGAIAVGAYALPVYEIYKAGEDPEWRPGLDLLGAYGLSLVVLPHWNNSEGGANVDTSRCFMGVARMERLLASLPSQVTALGIDEHTALVLDPAAEECTILGEGGVTVLRAGAEQRYASGQRFSVRELGQVRWPAPEAGISPEVWQAVAAAASPAPAGDAPPQEVLDLIQEREAARSRRQWSDADAIRDRLAAMGYRVVDTPTGPQWERSEG